MASRFWAGESSSESESEYSGSSEGEVAQKVPTSRWDVESDSDSEDERRVVKSAKDKAFESLKKSCGAIANHIKINDWSSILSDFDAMIKILEKSKNVVATQGYPLYYIRLLVQLEDFLNDTIKNKQAQKKMGKENNKSFIRMKGKLKKHNALHEKEIAAYRENPQDIEESESGSDESESSQASESEDEEESEQESEEESAQESDTEGSSGEASRKGSDSEDSDDSWPSASSSSSSDDEAVDTELKGRAKWLKTDVVSEDKKKDRKPKAAKPTVKAESVVVQTQQVEKELKLTPEQFDCKIKEIVASRGKRQTETFEQLAQLRKLVHYSRKLGVAREIIALMHLIGAELYDTSSKIDKVLSVRLWQVSFRDVDAVVKLLSDNPGFRLASLSSEDQADIIRAGKGELTEEHATSQALPEAGTEGTIRVSGNLFSYVEKLNEEYTKSLQQIDPHTSEYVARLRDEASLLDIAERVQAFYVRSEDLSTASLLALLRAELTYYKHDTIAKAIHSSGIRRQVFGNPEDIHPACLGSATVQPTGSFESFHPASISGNPVCEIPSIDTEETMRELCMFVYKYGDDRAKTRAMLAHIYHHAIHDRFHQAKDLLLMSHLQDTIVHTDVSTQILFNRMMAQLGLCAFRKGYIFESHSCLTEICAGVRVKELLAQGVQSARFSDKNSEQEKAERRRQTPYHMHINLELLECCHLTSAMLLEIPNMANSNGKQRVISKNFRRYLEYYERQVFAGPPENTRDHVIAAAKALAQGDWRKASNLVLNMPVWSLFPGDGVLDKVKNMVRRNIQVEALRTYLLAFSSEYDSMSLPQLCTMFDLPENAVHSVVSKMMINEELHAAWDQPSRSIIFHRVERSRLQALALKFADKTAMIVDNNEKLLDARTSCAFSLKDDWNRRGENRPGWNQRGGQQGTRNFNASRGQHVKSGSNQYTNKKPQSKRRTDNYQGGGGSGSRGDGGGNKRW